MDMSLSYEPAMEQLIKQSEDSYFLLSSLLHVERSREFIKSIDDIFEINKLGPGNIIRLKFLQSMENADRLLI